jgi:hypothetical protein
MRSRLARNKGGLALEFNLLQKHTMAVTSPASGCGISHKCDLIFGVRRSGNGCARPLFSIRAHACSEMKKKESARRRKGSQCNSEGLCFETCRRERLGAQNHLT